MVVQESKQRWQVSAHCWQCSIRCFPHSAAHSLHARRHSFSVGLNISFSGIDRAFKYIVAPLRTSVSAPEHPELTNERMTKKEQNCLRCRPWQYAMSMQVQVQVQSLGVQAQRPQLCAFICMRDDAQIYHTKRSTLMQCSSTAFPHRAIHHVKHPSIHLTQIRRKTPWQQTRVPFVADRGCSPDSSCLQQRRAGSKL
jgi:hypothetical protein